VPRFGPVDGKGDAVELAARGRREQPEAAIRASANRTVSTRTAPRVAAPGPRTTATCRAPKLTISAFAGMPWNCAAVAGAPAWEAPLNTRTAGQRGSAKRTVSTSAATPGRLAGSVSAVSGSAARAGTWQSSGAIIAIAHRHAARSCRCCNPAPPRRV
jgi:hypothetical protein